MGPAGTARTGILEEIGHQVAKLREDAARRGEVVLAPLLAVGTSERVGSNWLSDTLRPVMTQHNEPLRQELGADHPLSAQNLDPEDLGEARLNGLGRHWLAAFVAGKYAPRRHLVKETNLFFTTSVLLGLFPDSPVVVLSRSPLGVASSFTRADLWNRWSYRRRYTQLVAVTRAPGHRRWSPLVPDDDPAPLVGLTRMVVLNAVLLSEALGVRGHVHVAYERHVLDRAHVLESMDGLVPDWPRPTPSPQHIGPPSAGGGPGGDDTFATTVAKTRLVAHLDAVAAGVVAEQSAHCLAVASQIAEAQVVGRAGGWLSGAGLYRLTGISAGRPAPDRTRGPAPDRSQQHDPGPGHAPRGGLLWRSLLITNAEFATWLNDLQDAGLANTHTGTHLLATLMPHERGGRIHLDAPARTLRVSRGWQLPGRMDDVVSARSHG